MTLFYRYRYQRLPSFHRHLIEKSFLKPRILNFKRSKWGFLKSKIIAIIEQKKRLNKTVLLLRSRKGGKFPRWKKHKVKRVLSLTSLKVFKIKKSLIKISKLSNVNKHKVDKKNKLNLTSLQKTFFYLSSYTVLSSSKGGYWRRIKKSYKDGLVLSNYFKQCYGSSFYNSEFKKQLKFKYRTSFRLLLQPLFKLDILLWKLNFFVSARSAQQYIRDKKIFINNQLIKKSFILKSGDLIKINACDTTNILRTRLRCKSSYLYKSELFTLRKKLLLTKKIKKSCNILTKSIGKKDKREKQILRIKRNLKKKFSRLLRKKFNRFKSRFFFTNFLISFCEIDLYTRTIILLKDASSLEAEDLSITLKKNLDVSLFKYYLRKN